METFLSISLLSKMFICTILLVIKLTTTNFYFQFEGLLLALKNINLIRTSAYYRTDTLKALVINSLLSPLKSLIEKGKTEYFLKDINISIQNGERVAILGPNGSGKSTLCKLIASQLFASSGQIVNSFDVKLFNQIEHSFYKELSGRENLHYFIKFIYPELKKSEQIELIRQAADFSGLKDSLDKQIETYSSGMLSRLALSLVLAKKHDLLILDEIQSHADFEFRTKISARLKDIINASSAVIIVSHYVDEITESCERGIVLDKGKIIFDGKIQKAVAAYRILSGSPK